MKPKLPLWHRLLQPYFNWKADARERNDARRKLSEYVRVGYFLFGTNSDPDKQLEHICITLYQNGRGKRKAKYTGIEWMKDAFLKRPVVQAWLAGDDSVARFIHDKPFYRDGDKVKQ